MSFLLLFISFAFLAAGMAFIYKPALIVRFNKFVRERILNDNLILLERRKKGFFFLLIFLLFFYWGSSRFLYHPDPLGNNLVSTPRLLYQAHHHLHLKEYEEAKKLCLEILAREPANTEALYYLGAASFLLDDPVAAQKSWSRAKALSPASDTADHLRKLVVRCKNLSSEDIPALR